MNSIDWPTITEWLEIHGHVSFDWEEITNDSCVYCADSLENTFISIFTKTTGELMVYVGCFNPHISAGGDTGIYVETEWEIIDYLHDNLEDLFETLNTKLGWRN